MPDAVLQMIWGAAALMFGQVVGALAMPVLVRPINQWYALRRFRKEPLIDVGTRIVEIRQGGSDKPVCGPCVVTSLERGRIEVQLQRDTGWKLPLPHRMSWTLAEFEAFDPVVLKHDAFDPPVLKNGER